MSPQSATPSIQPDHFNPARPAEAAHRQTQELWLLNETRTTLARDVDLRTVCRVVVESTVKVFGYTQVSIYLLAGEVLHLQHQVGYETPYTQLSLSQGVIGRTVREGRPALIEDVHTDPAFIAAAPDVTSEICVPLFDRNQAVGAFNIESRGGVTLTEDDFRLMIALAEHINIAIERARLHSQLRQRNQVLTALHETTLAIVNQLELSALLEAILTRAAQLLGLADGFIALIEDDGAGAQGLVIKQAKGIFRKDARPIRPGQGLAGRVWQTGQPMAVADYGTWPDRLQENYLDSTHASVVVPLKSGPTVTGVLGVTRLTPGETFSAEEVELLTQFAELASITLDKARLYAALQQELDERRRIEAMLKNTNVELEQALLNAQELTIVAEAANNVKSQFLANMSHELRMPLSAVMGFNDLVLGTDLTTEQRQYAEQISASAVSLLKMLDDLLDVYKIDAGHMELEQMDFELDQLIQRAVTAITPQAATKNLNLSHEIAAGTPIQLVGDPIRLRQVLLNLLTNAVKFTDQGQIFLRVECDYQTSEDATLHFVVGDTGIGVPKEKQELIFSSFLQADSTLTRRHGGTGLGLTIARHLAEKFKGQMWVESEGVPGRGSRFHFTAMFGLTFQPGANTVLPATPQAPPPTLHTAFRFKILLAEDNAINGRVITRILEKRGWEVVVVEDGQAAVAVSSSETFDAILMDVQMPILDGLSATMAIRARERETGGHVPIVALTAYAMPGDRERCLAAGMDAYISKPMKALDLYAILEEVVGLKSS
jgi:signal transduction histidine kinase/ActR/RegA family two-component response regulator